MTEQLHPFILKHFEQLNKVVQERKENNEHCLIQAWFLPRIKLNDGTFLSIQFGYQIMSIRGVFQQIMFNIADINIMEIYLNVIYGSQEFDIAVGKEDTLEDGTRRDNLMKMGQATLNQVAEFVEGRTISEIPEDDSFISFLPQEAVNNILALYTSEPLAITE